MAWPRPMLQPSWTELYRVLRMLFIQQLIYRTHMLLKPVSVATSSGKWNSAWISNLIIVFNVSQKLFIKLCNDFLSEWVRGFNFQPTQHWPCLLFMTSATEKPRLPFSTWSSLIMNTSTKLDWWYERVKSSRCFSIQCHVFVPSVWLLHSRF